MRLVLALLLCSTVALADKPVKVDAVTLLRVRLLASELSNLEMQAAIKRREHAEFVAKMQKDFALVDGDTIKDSGEIVRAKK